MRTMRGTISALAAPAALAALAACGSHGTLPGLGGATSQLPSYRLVAHSAPTYTFKSLFSFHRTDGEGPSAGLTYAGGALYGTTESGGSRLDGVVFSIAPTTGQEKTLYSFGVDSALGVDPLGRLLLANGTLYGTLSHESVKNVGSVFTLAPGQTTPKLLYAFRDTPDGAHPNAGVLLAGGALYGTTIGGGYVDPGYNNLGTIYKIQPNSGAETNVHSFDRRYGNHPASDLIADTQHPNILYGTTEAGGKNFAGTIFAYNLKTGNFSTIHSFNGTDGGGPMAGLIDVNNVLYGTTNAGGTKKRGTVFSLDLTAHKYTVIYNFTGLDGAAPQAGLIDVKGVLYGTTYAGGSHGLGVVFSLDPATRTETVLQNFHGYDGAFPAAPLLELNGSLYGTTYGGGAGYGSAGYGHGTVFELVPAASNRRSP